MITIEYSGGLGNQLFQYAFSRALELDLNVSVFSDFSNYRRKEKRILCLDHRGRILRVSAKHLSLPLSP